MNHDHPLVLYIVASCFLLKGEDAGDEVGHPIRTMNQLVWFVEGREVTINLLSHRAWIMVFLEMRLMPLRFICLI